MLSKRLKEMFLVKILSVALLFIIRCRFPSNHSLASIVRQRYGDNVLKLLRKCEKSDNKLQKAKLDLQFLLNCRDHGLIPHFLQFKVANSRLRRALAYSTAQSRFLASEIKSKHAAISKLESLLSQQCCSLRSSVSCMDFAHLISKVSLTNSKSLKKQQEIQQKKFEHLQREQAGKHNDPDKVIFNYSSHVLTPVQKKVLAKGLNFALPPKKLKQCDYFLPFELLYRSISSLPVFGNNQEFVKTKLKEIAFSSLHNYNSAPPPPVLTKAERSALLELSSVPNLVIQKADKGNSVVLMDKKDYIEKTNHILSDESKFQKVPVTAGKELNLVLSHERKVRNILKSMLDKGTFHQDLYTKLLPTGSQPGKLYGLGKVHKPGCPVRPILSAIGTPSYSLAKLLVPMLAPVTVNHLTVKDSFSFAKEISGISSDGLYMASFDVKSLFTNIPLDETINICTNNLFKSAHKPQNIPKPDFKLLLQAAVKDMLFVFNSKFYKQVDGVAMGSPLGPTMANSFLSHHEQIWLDDCPTHFKPVLYRRYVDDVFLLFRCQEHVNQFLNYLNSKHANIEFSAECQVGDFLSFLDIGVRISNGSFSTSVYRKPTFSGVYSHFDSFMPKSYKFGLLYTLFHRSFLLSSSHAKFHDDICFLKTTLQKNGYPLSLIDCCVKLFLNRRYKGKSAVADTVEKKNVLIVLPFLGVGSIHVRNKIVNVCKNMLPQVNCKVVLKPCFRMSSLFPFKDRLPSGLRSSIVYKFLCSGCNATYYGQTVRHLHTRAAEHIGISHLTGKLVSPKPSAVYDHCLSCHANPTLSDFSVLCSGQCEFYLKVKESLLILQDSPVLNKNVSSLPLLLF